MSAKNGVPDEVWDEQANLYALGLKHANEIARDLGVSPQTVSRRMQQRGAVKGSRVSESIAELLAYLDRKARHSALMELQESERKREIADATMRAIGNMMAALLEADRQGDLRRAVPAIEHMGSVVAPRAKRQSRR